MSRLLIWVIIIASLAAVGYYAVGKFGFNVSGQKEEASIQAGDNLQAGIAAKLWQNSLQVFKSRLNLPDSNGQALTQKEVNPDTATSTRAQALKTYLLASSNLGFPEPIDVSMAVIAARNNQFERLKKLIDEFKAKQAQFLKLQVPEVAQEIHTQSVKIIEKYIDLLQKAYNSQRPEQVEAILNSQEADRLRAQAREVLGQIQELIKRFQIELPPEVIPANPQGLDTSRYEIGAALKKNSIQGKLSFLSLPKIAHIGTAQETAGTIEEILAQADANDCPLNDEPTDQCGGGKFPREGIGNCPRSTTLAYYTNCNYGNAPNILGEEESLHPLDPEPACSAVDDTPACACLPTPTPGCGVVLRLYPPGCDGCCPPLPVSAEQCCGGSAWLWDKVSGWVGCAEPRS